MFMVMLVFMSMTVLVDVFILGVLFMFVFFVLVIVAVNFEQTAFAKFANVHALDIHHLDLGGTGRKCIEGTIEEGFEIFANPEDQIGAFKLAGVGGAQGKAMRACCVSMSSSGVPTPSMTPATSECSGFMVATTLGAASAGGGCKKRDGGGGEKGEGFIGHCRKGSRRLCYDITQRCNAITLRLESMRICQDRA